MVKREPLMKIKKAAIVGHINSGKSSLFNAIIKRKKAIVDKFPGLTIDRNYNTVTYENCTFTLIDTGGILFNEQDSILKRTLEQTMIAIEEADIIIFLLEYPVIQSVDYEIADLLRKSGKHIIPVVNKVDNEAREYDIGEFHSFGFKGIIPISVVHHKNIYRILDRIKKEFPTGAVDSKKILKIAIVGKPNSGKSTLLNKIAGSERVVVNEKPGTTRDSIDIMVKRENKEYIFIDTAGIRKKGRIKSDVEYYSLNRTIRAIKDADIVLHLIDAPEGLSENDKKISSEIERNRKPCIIYLNKWDLIEKETNTANEMIDKINFQFPHVKHIPIYTIAAKTGLRISKIFTQIDAIEENRNLKISTPQLNKMIEQAMRKYVGPRKKGELKIYYGTQAEISPPLFILFINKKKLFTKNYKRYLGNYFRSVFDLSGVPIIFKAKEHRNDH